MSEKFEVNNVTAEQAKNLTAHFAPELSSILGPVAQQPTQSAFSEGFLKKSKEEEQQQEVFSASAQGLVAALTGDAKLGETLCEAAVGTIRESKWKSPTNTYAKVVSQLARIEEHQGKYTEAQSHFLEAYLAERAVHPGSEGKILAEIARINKRMGLSDKAQQLEVMATKMAGNSNRIKETADPKQEDKLWREKSNFFKTGTR